MNVCQSLTSTSAWCPNQIAIRFAGVDYSYETLNQKTEACAGILKSLGVSPGDRVVLILPNSIAFPAWYYGALRIGAIAVSVNTRLAGSEMAFIINDCQATVVIGNDPTCKELSSIETPSVKNYLPVDEMLGEPDRDDMICSPESEVFQAKPDDPAVILYTSGTTGFPKGAVLSHNNVRSNVAAFNHLCKMDRGTSVLLAVPMFHCFGQNALLNSVLNVGGTIVLQQRFDLNETKSLILEQQVDQIYGVPMMFSLMLEHFTQRDLASVSYFFSAAAPLAIQTSRGWLEKFGLPINEGYGLTETSPFATYNHRVDYRIGSIGTPIDNSEVKVVDTTTGEPCGPGELGEIAIRGPNVMLGYWNRPEETKSAIREGWFFSGDIGRMDEDGFLFIVDRVKDMIAVGGLKVFPAEVERVLQDHPSVSESAVIGVPDEVLGERVVAYLVGASSDQSDLDSIKQHCIDQLGSYKLPRHYYWIDKLPRNPSGKVLKTTLRDKATHELSLTVPASPDNFGHRPTLIDRLEQCYPNERTAIATDFLVDLVLAISGSEQKIDGADSLMNVGLDSMGLVDLTTRLQIEFGEAVSFPATLVFDYPDIDSLANFLAQQALQQQASQLSTEKQSIVKKDDSSSPASQPPIDQNQFIPSQLRSEVEAMSEQEALQELMKELED